MFKIVKSCALVGCMTIFSASATELDKVFSLIDQRLAYMKDVAGYKAENHLAIEDVNQEQKVLQNVISLAERSGLDANSIKPFFIALMDAAKAIQYRYRADWLSTPETAWQPQSLEKIRPQIAELSHLLIIELHGILLSGQRIDKASRLKLMKIINQPNLSEADKERIFISMQAVKLKQ